MNKKLLAIIIILSISFSLLSCKKNNPLPKPTPNKKEKIGMSFADQKEANTEILKKNLEKLSKDQKVDLNFSDAKKDPIKQIADIDKMLEDDIKTIIVQPVNGLMIKEIVTKIKSKDGKVIVLETLPPNVSFDAFVSPDYLRAGEIQGQQLIELAPIKENLNVLILKGDPSDPIAVNVTEGNLKILKNNKAISNIEVMNCLQGDMTQAYNNTNKVYSLWNGKLDAVIANDSELIIGALQFLQEKGLTDKVITLGVGADPKALESISSGIHDGEIDVMPELIASYALQAAKSLETEGYWEFDQHIQNGISDVAARILPVRLINQTNLYLVKERIEKKNEKKEKNESDKNNSEENSKENESQEDKNKGESTIIFVIKTKEGLKYEVPIQGQIESIEIKEPEKKEEEKKSE